MSGGSGESLAPPGERETGAAPAAPARGRAWRGRRLGRAGAWLAPLLAILALIGLWQIYVLTSGVDALVLPGPGAVLTALYRDRGTLASNLGTSALEILLGILVAGLIGLAGAVLIHLSAAARRMFYPLLVASQAVPVVILIPVLVLWLGFGLLPKLAVIGLVCFFPIVVTTLAGLDTVDPELIKLMRTLDASRRDVFLRVELPSALPGLFTGVKLAAVFAVIGDVFAEQSGATSGLGLLLQVTTANLELAEAFATVLVLSGFAILLFALLSVVERRAAPWAYRGKDSASR